MAVLRIQENIKKADETYDVVHKETEASLVLFDDNETFQQKYDAGKLNGKDGKSPYQQAVEGGYTGTEEEFNAIMASGPWLPTAGGVVTGDVKISGDNSGVVFDGASVKLGLSANNLAVVTEDSTRGNPIYQPLQVASPIGNNDAATKKYVDDTFANAGGIQGNSVVIGPNASSENTDHSSVVIGYEAKDTNGDSIAIGFKAESSSFGAIAIGSYAHAVGNNSIAIGSWSAAGSYFGSIALGDGSNAAGSYSVAIGGSAQTSSDFSISIGRSANATGLSSVAIGINSTASGTYSIVLGCNANADHNYDSVAIGNNANVQGNYAIAIGSGARTFTGNSISIGHNASGCYAGSVALGKEAGANGAYAVAIGCYATSGGFKSTALGAEANTNTNDTSVMQLGSTTLAALRCAVYLSVQSDIRDKIDITPISDGAIELLEKITPISYFRNPRTAYIDMENLSETDAENRRKFGLCEYDRESHAAGEKKGSRRRVGVSAQAVQEALEEVYGSSSYANIVNDNLYDVDPAEIPDGVENQLTVNYEGFIPFLIKAIQELSTRVKELEEVQK